MAILNKKDEMRNPNHRSTVPPLWEVCATEEFLDRCREFAELKKGPLPVLKPPWDHRIESAVGERDGDWQYPAAEKSWPGVVMATCEDEQFRALAALLAAATGRPLITSFGKAPAGGPIAYVGPAREMTADVLMSFGSREFGVVTGYDIVDASALVARTVLATQWLSSRGPARRGVHVTPLAEERSRPHGHRGLFRDTGPVDLLALAGHGRECGFQLQDGIICAGQEVRPQVCDSEGALRSCDVSDECYYRGYGTDKRVAASQLDAAVVFVAACQSFAIGTNRFSGTSSLALSFVSGSAVAVIGTPWVHTEDYQAAKLFARWLGEGARLGESVRIVNDCYRTMQLGPRYCLLGDPALTFPTDPSAAETRNELELPSPPGWTPPALMPSVGSDSPSSGGPQALMDVLGRVRLLDDLDDAVQGLLRSAGACETAGDGPSRVGTCASAAQVDEVLVRQTLALTKHSWYHFSESWWNNSQTECMRYRKCQDCGAESAEELSLVHAADRNAVLFVGTCPRCGIIQESMLSGVNLSITQYFEESAQGRSTVCLEVQTSRSGGTAWIGAEVLAAEYYEAYVSTPPSAVSLDVTGRAKYRFAVVRRATGPAVDLLRVKVYCAMGGSLTCRSVNLYAGDLRGKRKPEMR